MNPALLKYLQSLGPEAANLLKSLGGAGKAIGKVGLEEGGKLAGEFPKTAAAAGGGGLAALLGSLGEDDEEAGPQYGGGY